MKTRGLVSSLMLIERCKVDLRVLNIFFSAVCLEMPTHIAQQIREFPSFFFDLSCYINFCKCYDTIMINDTLLSVSYTYKGLYHALLTLGFASHCKEIRTLTAADQLLRNT